jgi:hypothetical protein
MESPSGSDSEFDPQEAVKILSSMLGREVKLADKPHDLENDDKTIGNEDSDEDSPSFMAKDVGLGNQVKKDLKSAAEQTSASRATTSTGFATSHTADVSRLPADDSELPPYYDLVKEAIAPKDVEFTSWLVASAYPDYYIGKANKPLV